MIPCFSCLRCQQSPHAASGPYRNRDNWHWRAQDTELHVLKERLKICHLFQNLSSSDPPQGPLITEDALFSSIGSSRADLHSFPVQLTPLLCSLRRPCKMATSDKRLQNHFAHWFDSFTLTWPLARFSRNE